MTINMVLECPSHWCWAKGIYHTCLPMSKLYRHTLRHRESQTAPLCIANGPAHLLVSGSNSTTRCWKVSHPWRSHRSWREAWHRARTYPGKWHWSPRDPAAGHSSCRVCWTSSLRNPYRLVGCWCQILQEDRQIFPSWTLACPQRRNHSKVKPCPL